MSLNRLSFVLLVSAAMQIGCGGDDGPGAQSGGGSSGTSGSAGKTGLPHEPPPPAESAEPCIISADCPSGTYCDLGQCLQSCSTRTPCDNGFECSARGRCVEPNRPDVDPPPVTEHAGSVVADAVAPELSELDDSFVITLTSDVDAVVPYRVEVKAPFLHYQQPERGEFSKTTTLRFRVDPEGKSGTVTPGTVLIHTALGDVVVNPSLRVGLSGRYQGLLRYTSGKTPLGDVGLTVDMLDDNGDVKVRVDPEHSMTLPELRGAPATGRGAFTFSQGLSVNVEQVLPSDYGGARNHFQRPVGRRLSFSLKPIGRGRLEGTFAEKIHGVLRQPIALSGTVYLEPVRALESPDFDVPEALVMPAVDANVFPTAEVFPGWNDTSCFSDCAGAADKLLCVKNTIEPVYYEQLVATLSGVRPSADPVGEIAGLCENELSIRSTGEYRAGARQCALIPPLACALKYVATNTSFGTAELPMARAAYNRLFARSLAPALLVSQDHIVSGLKESFTIGLGAQGERFAKARTILGPPATFLLASGVLDYLRALPAEIAKGESASTDPTRSNFPAARALARLLYVLNTLDGEEARSNAMDVTAAPDKKRQAAQQRGVLAFLEAATLASVLDAWGNPPSVGNEFIGSLTLADRGFTALTQGALVFGVPEGEVPMVFEPLRPQPTNFEQFHVGHARPALDRFTKDQTAFEAADREFEQSASLLNSEIEGVRKSYEDQIKAICGNAFDLSTIRLDADWARCGAGGSGEFAELTLEIEQAYLRLQASQSRIEGMKHKYRIDEKRLMDTQKVRREQIRFLDQNGKALEGLAVQEGIINVAQKTLDIASEANLWNGGAPLAMAAVTGVLEGMRTQITVARQQLQTAQSMRSVADENAIDLISGMAELQKQIVDTAQLELEMEQDTLGITQADLRRRNTLDRAKRLFEERLRSLDRISKSPLTDPTHRILQTRLALQAVASRANAQRALYRAARALEYEINTPLGDALSRAVLGAYNATEAERLSDCLDAIFREHTTQFGAPQEFVTTISVRDMLGFTAPRRDAVTGEELSQGRLFRQWILRNENIDPAGNVAVTFGTNLQPGNGLWSTNVCDDKVATVQAQIVGDFQGDNAAELQIALEGGSVMRRCDSDEVINWGIDAPPPATIQAGVNSFGEARPNALLFGQSVARASWRITIPAKGSAPANADLDIEAVDDIVLKITHKALSRRSQSIPIDTSCLGSVGAGG